MKLTPLLFCFSAILKPPVVRTVPALATAAQVVHKHTHAQIVKQLKKEIGQLEKERSREVDEHCRDFAFNMHAERFGTLERFGWDGAAIVSGYDARIAHLKRKLSALEKNKIE